MHGVKMKIVNYSLFKTSIELLRVSALSCLVGV